MLYLRTSLGSKDYSLTLFSTISAESIKTDSIKQEFFQVGAESVQLYGCTNKRLIYIYGEKVWLELHKNAFRCFE